MRHTISILIICLCFVFEAKAQNNFCGVYKSAQDYQNNLLSVKTECDKNDKIKAHQLFSEKCVEVIKDGIKTRFCKDSLFGYRDCDQSDYRFSNGDEYQIRENNTIVIYTINERVYSGSGKTYELKPAYLFSNGLNGEILLLTLLNLKKAFPDNYKFHDLLDTQFTDGITISNYDTQHKMFKVNYLLSKSEIK